MEQDDLFAEIKRILGNPEKVRLLGFLILLCFVLTLCIQQILISAKLIVF